VRHHLGLGHRNTGPESVRRHLFVEWPRAVRKWFNRGHWCRGRSKLTAALHRLTLKSALTAYARVTCRTAETLSDRTLERVERQDEIHCTRPPRFRCRFRWIYLQKQWKQNKTHNKTLQWLSNCIIQFTCRHFDPLLKFITKNLLTELYLWGKWQNYWKHELHGEVHSILNLEVPDRYEPREPWYLVTPLLKWHCIAC